MKAWAAMPGPFCWCGGLVVAGGEMHARVEGGFELCVRLAHQLALRLGCPDLLIGCP
jgi:hypothetical protein